MNMEWAHNKYYVVHSSHVPKEALKECDKIKIGKEKKKYMLPVKERIIVAPVSDDVKNLQQLLCRASKPYYLLFILCTILLNFIQQSSECCFPVSAP